MSCTDTTGMTHIPIIKGMSTPFTINQSGSLFFNNIGMAVDVNTRPIGTVIILLPLPFVRAIQLSSFCG